MHTEKFIYTLGKTLRVLTVCGVGQGSSLIMKMFVEDVLKELGTPARVETAEIVTAKAGGADIIICSIIHEPELRGSAPVVIGLKSLVNKNEMREKIKNALMDKGWIKKV